MGVYLRYAAALIILAIATDSYAVTRKNVSMPSKESVITNSGSSFQTPNGPTAYYGRDHVDYHTPGNRFNSGDSPAPPKQKIVVKPTLNVDPKKAAKALVAGLRGGIPGAIASAATAAILAGVDAVMAPDGSILTPSIQEAPSTGPNDFTWVIAIGSKSWTRPTPNSSCSAYAESLADATFTFRVDSTPKFTEANFTCNVMRKRLSTGTEQLISPQPIYRLGAACPSGSAYNSATGVCSTSVLIRDIVKESCSGSLSPAACYDKLSEWGDLQGPSSATAPAETTTTTTQNPDASTSTTTTTTQNKYDYNYGDNYYNYSTTTTTTTDTDGQTTTTATSDGSPTDTPSREENPSEEEQEYTFADSPMPDVPSFYEQKYPDGLAGVWTNASSALDGSGFVTFLNGFVPSFSGSCPTFGLNFSIASWASYGTIGFSSLCYVFDFIKIILLVTALFTFRAITFGG
jgi:hypothetical protein